MVVDVAEIDFYDRNPRRAENPELQNIKNGIRASKGLDWVLNITRRPGAEHYTLSAGGNTTLSFSEAFTMPASLRSLCSVIS